MAAKNNLRTGIVMKHIVFLLIILNTVILSADNEDFFLQDHLKTVEKNPKEYYAREKIIYKEDILYCTGNSSAALLNNKAASLMKDEIERQKQEMKKMEKKTQMK